MDEETEVSDQELVARTQAGDPSAFDDLVRRFTPRLYGLIYNMTSNHEDTNDLLQEVFAKAYRSIREAQKAQRGQILNVESLLSIFSSWPDHSA